MQSVLRRSVMVAGACLLLTGATANAAAGHVMDVKIPFSFLVNGDTLPAGQYRVEQLGNSAVLLRGERGIHVAEIVAISPAREKEPAGTVEALGFTRHENQYRLSNVWEPDGEGFSVSGR
jgi:hypothetical protein